MNDQYREMPPGLTGVVTGVDLQRDKGGGQDGVAGMEVEMKRG